VYKYKLIEHRKVVIGIALLLTGSLTATLGLVIAIGLTFLLLVFSKRNLLVSVVLWRKVFVRLALVVLIVIAVDFSLSGLLIKTISGRIAKLVSLGLEGSNRGYIYGFVSNNPIPLFGYGIGNANLVMLNYFHGINVMSFLNLYLNVVYSTGILGLLLVSVFLVYPIARIMRLSGKQDLLGCFFFLWGYLTWLVMFVVHSEEFSFMFGIAYGVLICLGRKRTLNVVKGSVFRESFA
jgi:O-antigen ligase